MQQSHRSKQMNFSFTTIQQEDDTFKQRALGSLTVDLFHASQQLSRVTKQHTACLEEFLASQTLVTWVKENLKGEEPKSPD